VTDFKQLLHLLSTSKVDFILVGGMAATVHGATRLTQDLDIVYSRSRANLERLAAALAPYEPYLRGAPPGLPFRWDAATLERGLNFTLTTSLGDLDLLGEITGGGGYENLVSHSSPIEIFGETCRCLDLPALIQAKRATGRPRDLEVLAELEALLEERRRLDSTGPRR
jgi:hypothetical protein